MNYIIWRETLLIFLFWMCVIVTSVSAFQVIVDVAPTHIWTFIIGFTLSATLLVLLSKAGLSLAQFIRVLENNGFEMVHKKSSMLLGITSDGVIVKGFFYWKYGILNEDLFLESAKSNNLQFYFPCTTPGILNHYIVKRLTNFKFGLNKIWRRNDTYLTISESEFQRIIFNICSDIDFLAINHLSSGPGFIRISTGPKSLLHGNYAEKNIRNIFKFIKAYKNYFGCQNVKWSTDINVENLNEKIQQIENSCTTTFKNIN